MNTGKRKEQDEHLLKTIYTGGVGDGDLLILAHIDIDGAVCAYLTMEALKTKYRSIYVIFTKPYTSLQLHKFLLSKSSTLDKCDVILVDLAINQMCPRSTGYLLEYLLKNMHLLYIIDHHVGWEKFITQQRFNELIVCHMDDTITGNVVLGSTPSCAELVYKLFNLSDEDKYLSDLRDIARISDDLTVRKTYENTQLYDMFSNLKGETTSDTLDRLINHDLTTTNTWYSTKTNEVLEYITRAKEVYPGIGFIQVLSDSTVNRTLLCEQGYKKYSVFIISELNTRKMRITYTIATTLGNANLVDMFSLKAGCPKKISVCRRHIDVDYIVNKFKPFL